MQIHRFALHMLNWLESHAWFRKTTLFSKSITSPIRVAIILFTQGDTGYRFTAFQNELHIQTGSNEEEHNARQQTTLNILVGVTIMSKECQESSKAVPAPKTNEFAGLGDAVAKTAYNLENHQNNAGQSESVNAILNEVYGTALKGKSADYKAAFVDFLDRKLDADEKKGAVLDEFAQENFNFLSNGKKRIQTADLDGKAQELGMMNRSIEQRLTEDLSDQQTAIEKSKHEGVFLGLGHKHGIDRKRLSSFDQKEDDKAASENVLKSVATPYQFDSITGGTDYRTGTESLDKAQLEGTINPGAAPSERLPYLSYNQLDALSYVDDHFNKMSQTVPTYDGDYQRVVTVDSMTKYAKKHGATWNTIAQNRASNAQYNSDLQSIQSLD